MDTNTPKAPGLDDPLITGVVDALAKLAGSHPGFRPVHAKGIMCTGHFTPAPDAATPVELGRRLAELGFLPGEAVRIVARGLMKRAPIAVRIGTGTFALRLFEAACIRVCPEQPQPA